MKTIVHNRNSILVGITPFLGKPVVKVITGMRRSGKSCLLRSIIQKLRKGGVHHGIRRLHIPEFLGGESPQ